MRYTVTWIPSAQAELASIWNHAIDRADVTRAANQIDSALETDPHRNAVPFYGDWLLVEPPLAVVFTIDGASSKVEVTQVWYK